MDYKAGDQIERDFEPEKGDNSSKKKEGRIISPNVFEEDEMNIYQTTEDHKKELVDNLSFFERFYQKISQTISIPRNEFAAIVKHVKKYGARSLAMKSEIQHIVSLPLGYAGKIMKVLLLSLLVVGASKGTIDTVKWFHKKDISNVLKGIDSAEKEVIYSDLAGHGQTKLTGFHGAMLDATNPNIFEQTYMIELEGANADLIRNIDYKKNLDLLRQFKFTNRKSSKVRAAKTGIYDRTIKKLLASKKPFTKYSLEKRNKDMSGSINNINKNIDRNKVAELTGVDKDHVPLLKSVFNRMESKHVLSYMCTELFGDLGGEFSINYLEYLFKKGGQEYVYHIPAVYDNMASFGPYQLTSAVVRHDNTTKGSANRIQEALPEKLQTIPGSMYLLTMDQQNDATYLNMIYNLALLIRILEKNNVSDKQFKKLSNADMETFLQYLAVSHNSPLVATRSMKGCVTDNMKKPFENYIHAKGKKIYAQRTTKFYNAVNTYYNKK